MESKTKTELQGRRGFLGWVYAGLSAWIGAVVVGPVARLILFPLRERGGEADWSDLGPVENFQGGGAPVARPVNFERRDGWQQVVSQQSVYVVDASGPNPRVLSSVCPHLGCTVQWRSEQDTFQCPCHGGTYAKDGARLAGPANRGMDTLPARVQQGRLYVKFQYFRQLIADKQVVE